MFRLIRVIVMAMVMVRVEDRVMVRVRVRVTGTLAVPSSALPRLTVHIYAPCLPTVHNNRVVKHKWTPATHTHTHTHTHMAANNAEAQ